MFRLVYRSISIPVINQVAPALRPVDVPHGCKSFVIKMLDADAEWYVNTDGTFSQDGTAAWRVSAGAALRLEGPCLGHKIYVAHGESSAQTFQVFYEEFVNVGQ